MSSLLRRKIEGTQSVHQKPGRRVGLGMPQGQLQEQRFYTARGLKIGGFRTIKDHLETFQARKTEAIRRKLLGVAG